MHSITLALSLSLALVACGKKAPPTTDATASTTTTAPATAATGAPAGEDAGPAGGSSATGEGAADAAAASECPKSLEGYDVKVDRVITKACGVVPVTGHYAIDDGTLTLEAGATLAFKDGADLDVGYNTAAKLIVKGTKDEPVTFTSLGDKAPGVWNGVRLNAAAARSSLSHLQIEWAGGETGAALVADAPDLALEAISVKGSKGFGIDLGRDVVPKALSGLAFADIGKAALRLDPKAVGALGEGNTFPSGATIDVWGGSIDKATVWPNPGVPYVLGEAVRIDGGAAAKPRWEIAAGAELRLGPQAFLEVGYANPGALKLSGTKDKPVVVTSATDKKAGAHAGIRIYSVGEAELEGVVVVYGNDEGAIRAQGGTVMVKDAAVRHSGAGIVLTADVVLKGLTGTAFEDCGKAALSLFSAQLGAVGAGNTYDAAALVDVEGSPIHEAVTWAPQAATTTLRGTTVVEDKGALTIPAGSKLRMAEGAEIRVGDVSTGSLKITGTAEQPVELFGERDEPAVWRGFQLYGNTRDSTLSFVTLKNAASDTAVINVTGEAVVSVSDVTCAKCGAPTLGWECASKVTQTNVKGLDGTPADLKKPEGCQ